jgi:hypothetical protein
MTPSVFYKSVIAPRASLLPQHDSPEARCLLMAIAGQESGWSERIQQPVGYARGFWQCEKNGAVLAVLTGESTKADITGICETLCIPTGLDEVFEAIAWNDTLAYWVARLALFQDPQPLPVLGQASAAWATYTRVWRPGTPRITSWSDRYSDALAQFDLTRTEIEARVAERLNPPPSAP